MLLTSAFSRAMKITLKIWNIKFKVNSSYFEKYLLLNDDSRENALAISASLAKVHNTDTKESTFCWSN